MFFALFAVFIEFYFFFLLHLIFIRDVVVPFTD